MFLTLHLPPDCFSRYQRKYCNHLIASSQEYLITAAESPRREPQGIPFTGPGHQAAQSEDQSRDVKLRHETTDLKKKKKLTCRWNVLFLW